MVGGTQASLPSNQKQDKGTENSNDECSDIVHVSNVDMDVDLIPSFNRIPTSESSGTSLRVVEESVTSVESRTSPPAERLDQHVIECSEDANVLETPAFVEENDAPCPPVEENEPLRSSWTTQPKEAGKRAERRGRGGE